MTSGKIIQGAELYVITPSDSTSYTPPFRVLYANVGGDVYVDAPTLGTNIKIIIPTGSRWDACSISKIYATGTGGSVDLLGVK